MEEELDIPMVTWAPTPISNRVNILKRIGAMKYVPTKAPAKNNNDAGIIIDLSISFSLLFNAGSINLETSNIITGMDMISARAIHV